MQQKNMIIWCMLTQTWSACTDIIFCHFRPFFAFFALLLTPKINIWKKLKKAPEHIILLHMCTINQDHITYYSWDMKFNRHNFFVILGNFLLFTPPPLTPWKMKISKMKNTLEISSFYASVPKNHDHMLHSSWDMARVGCNYF